MSADRPQATITLATKITIGRILLIPVFVLAAIYYIVSVKEGQPNEYLRWATLAIFLVTSVTDALDGYIARIRNEQTRLGTLLDPVADKLLLVSGLILLAGPWAHVFNPHIPIWYVLLVISRDAILVIGTVFIHMTVGQIEVRPSLAGKASTFLQMVIISWVLTEWSVRIFNWIIGGAAVCTLISAAQYILDGVRQLGKAHAHEQAAKSV